MTSIISVISVIPPPPPPPGNGGVTVGWWEELGDGVKNVTEQSRQEQNKAKQKNSVF